ncbi:MAG: DUF4037 domain-containing protein [Roseburia sp.]|nr:DUF4037 domain-containing protein [Ruminococcus sp.]MCM1154599.1 DUF4037 domain-containing protein [Roseburia sp.]MCM1241684.1 DUF4037 domain-containing protein [Roseburia sp.]
MGKENMKGLELSRKYYEAYGRKMLAQFPGLAGEFAAGLVGRGSECFGFDDEFSRDHDYGPSFCVWLRKETYERFGKELQNAYDAMPREFMGFPARVTEKTGGGRVGVLCIEDFYYGLLGIDHVPASLMEWLRLRDEDLATATNGEVFEDRQGLFTQIRNGLLAYYPEDVRIKKIAARMAGMSRAGQYNYARAMLRGERVAAELFLQEFIKECMELVYLLNRRYAPFIKWMHRGIRELGTCFEIGDMTALFYQTEKMEDRVLIIEAICNVIVQELHAQGLSESESNFLQDHLEEVMGKITDERLRGMQVLEG